jgi:hypothetical protein
MAMWPVGLTGFCGEGGEARDCEEERHGGREWARALLAGDLAHRSLETEVAVEDGDVAGGLDRFM